MDIRVGFGVDLHQLKEGLPLFIGGVEIDASFGASGHSDADVLIHAICDALLGALNLRDIGFHFSDTDPKYEGIDSKILLKKVMGLINEKKYKVSNIDSTIILENPKLNPYVLEMQKCLAQIIGINEDRISIKATTNEKLGEIGKSEAIKAYSTVLVIK
jgi:2-C-methyl-D-erythritol 2,4-cyclodiphosphate synthase